MHTKYTIVNDKAVVVDEDNTITLYDNKDSIGEILNIENEIEVLKIKEDDLEYNLKAIEDEYKKRNYGAYSVTRFLSKINLAMVASLLFVGFYTNTFSFISFLLPMEVVMGFSINHFNKMAKAQYKKAHRNLKNDIDRNYSKLENLEDRLSNLKENTKAQEVESYDTNIKFLRNLRDNYMKTYRSTSDKVKKLK